MIAYALQIACITLLAEVLFRVVPVASAGFRYAYWRLVLAGALLMPWVIRAIPAPTAMSADAAPAAIPLVGVVEMPAIAANLSGPETSWLPLLPWMYAAGVAVRLLWVSVGMVRLRRFRSAGAPISDTDCDEIQRALGTSAELRAVRGSASRSPSVCGGRSYCCRPRCSRHANRPGAPC